MKANMKAAKERYNISLCFYCKRASPKKCPFIKNGTPVYTKATTKEMDLQDAPGKATVTIVKECPFFHEIE